MSSSVVVLVYRNVNMLYKISSEKRTLKSRGGTIGDLLVYASLIPPAMRRQIPTVTSAIADGFDPGPMSHKMHGLNAQIATYSSLHSR